MKKENKSAFFKGKGFYAALTAGVAAVFAVGIIGTHMLSNENKNVEQNKQPSSIAEQKRDELKVADAGQEKKKISEEQKEQIAENTEEKKAPDTEDGSSETDKKKDEQISDIGKTEETAEAEEPMKAVLSNDSKISNQSFDEDAGLLWPIKGEIVLDYSMDKPVYFKTLAQYKCNPALLIAGKKNMDVVSAAAGVITKVDKNEETGITITASIGDDYQLVYGQLADVKVKKGDQVKAGQVLGKLAEPTKYYKEEGTNLFFEVLEGEESVNPLLLLQ
ncbi:peptidoglycan DD-metalloendopeptidase family protein [Velocimicrobium porci]|uniref:M23 family metallopeptidase n=1 Tax=Velocimicrobium porci TaxID=2606634 RepID=A0A6L5Y0S0_9FIRM|nr:M23 family metallopeptidase [Velocimicrobium porci]MSS64544.1 M23 family metallopeptidase [Velocimicrobium porci]